MVKYIELEKIAELKKKWILSEDEFQFEKNLILNDIDDDTSNIQNIEPLKDIITKKENSHKKNGNSTLFLFSFWIIVLFIIIWISYANSDGWNKFINSFNKASIDLENKNFSLKKENETLKKENTSLVNENEILKNATDKIKCWIKYSDWKESDEEYTCDSIVWLMNERDSYKNITPTRSFVPIISPPVKTYQQKQAEETKNEINKEILKNLNERTYNQMYNDAGYEGPQ